MFGIIEALLFLELSKNVWIGSSIQYGNEDIDLKTEIKTSIEAIDIKHIATIPKQVNYNLKLGFNFNQEYRIEFEENCLHDLDIKIVQPKNVKNLKSYNSKVINYHSVKFYHYNLNWID